MAQGFLVHLMIFQCIFSPRIELREGERAVVPLNDLVLPDADTTVTGTVTMLSDKMQVLDIVSIEDGTAYRRARIILDNPVSPYGGGIITARIHPTEGEFSGYMIKARLLDWSEETTDREEVQESVLKALHRQHRRLERLVRKLGFEGWSFEGTLMLMGFAENSNLIIWSVTGKGFQEGVLERHPVIVFWSTPRGKIKRAFLTVSGQFYEAE